MWILPLVGYLGILVGFAFLTLAIASGLYYLSELVEEHTVFARKLLTRLIYIIIATQILLWLFDSFPFFLSLLSIFSHIVYASNLRHFPTVKLSDPLFILSCVLVILNHWLWFRHFSVAPQRNDMRQAHRDRFQSTIPQPTFTEIASYFGLCVWLVPFALFVSLSAGENVLPSMGSEYATGERPGVGGQAGADTKAKSKGMAKVLVDRVREWMGETGEVMGFWREEHARAF